MIPNLVMHKKVGPGSYFNLIVKDWQTWLTLEPDCSNLNVILLHIDRLKDDLLIVGAQSVAKFASKLTPYPMFGTQELLGKERSFQLVHSILFGMDHLSG